MFLQNEKTFEKKLTYDFLINETGLKLAFYMTEGLITGTNITFSFCTYYHASHASTGPHDLIREINTTNKNAKILIGTGYVKATCQVAAFE